MTEFQSENSDIWHSLELAEGGSSGEANPKEETQSWYFSCGCLYPS